jgi:hypothetical protein
VFHIKRNTNYYQWKTWSAKRPVEINYWILVTTYRCFSWWSVPSLYGRYFSCCPRRVLLTNKSFLGPEILSRIAVLLCHLIFHCQYIYIYWSASRAVETISMRGNFPEWTHGLVVNATCLNVLSFYSNGVISGLATRVSFITVSHMRFGESTRKKTELELFVISFLYGSTWLLLGCVLNDLSYTCAHNWL